MNDYGNPMNPLKPGTICWLTGTIPENQGKVVEVRGFLGNYPEAGDVYQVISKDGILVETCWFRDRNIVVRSQRRLQYEISALRQQLIPINNPGIDTTEEEQAPKWEKFEFPQL